MADTALCEWCHQRRRTVLDLAPTGGDGAQLQRQELLREAGGADRVPGARGDLRACRGCGAPWHSVSCFSCAVVSLKRQRGVEQLIGGVATKLRYGPSGTSLHQLHDLYYPAGDRADGSHLHAGGDVGGSQRAALRLHDRPQPAGRHAAPVHRQVLIIKEPLPGLKLSAFLHVYLCGRRLCFGIAKLPSLERPGVFQGGISVPVRRVIRWALDSCFCKE